MSLYCEPPLEIGLRASLGSTIQKLLENRGAQISLDEDDGVNTAALSDQGSAVVMRLWPIA